MIAAKQFEDIDGPEREKLEDTLDAILMGDQLKSLKADIGPKFREFRHANEFVGTKGGVIWSVRNVDDNPNKELHGDPHKKMDMPALPESIIPFLEKLQAAQDSYDKTLIDLESRKSELYADWYRYMHCAYPPPGETEEYLDVNEIGAMIINGSLARYRQAKTDMGQELHGPKKMKVSSSDESLAGQVIKDLSKLQTQLEEITRDRIRRIIEECIGRIIENTKMAIIAIEEKTNIKIEIGGERNVIEEIITGVTESILSLIHI